MLLILVEGCQDRGDVILFTIYFCCLIVLVLAMLGELIDEGPVM